MVPGATLIRQQHTGAMNRAEKWLERFPALVTKEREKLGLTRIELAERLGVTRQAVDSWERGISLPSLPQFLALAELFGWPMPK